MDNLRLFIAVLIPEDVRERVAEIESRLMASGADVKWVPAKNLHITLKFLGNVEPDRLDAIKHAAESAVKDVASFGVVLTGVGAFPNARRPSVVWVGIDGGHEELEILAERVEAALEPLGFERESRPFSPHITVGRVKSPMGIEKLRDEVEGLSKEYAGAFPVESISVMKSDLRPSGPTYSEVADFGLRISD